MRRDSDLIRAILLAVEADEHCEVLQLPCVDGYSRETFQFHVLLLVEEGLLRTTAPKAVSLKGSWICLRLTWEGYDFLDHIRDPLVWRSVKRAASKVGSWSIETLAAIAKSIILAKIEALGIAA